MSELFLYHTPGACSRVTMNALEEAGLEYKDRAINIFVGEQKSPEYQAINPKGKVPALKVDDQILTENVAILMYIHMLKPEANLLPVADTAFDKAKLYSDLVWFSSTFHPIVRQVLMPMRFTDGDPSGVFEKGVEYIKDLLPGILERLGNDGWWYGDNWSILDVYLYWCYTTAAASQGDYFSLKDYPALLAHAERVQARPSFQRARLREETAMKKAGIELPGGRLP